MNNANDDNQLSNNSNQSNISDNDYPNFTDNSLDESYFNNQLDIDFDTDVSNDLKKSNFDNDANNFIKNENLSTNFESKNIKQKNINQNITNNQNQNLDISFDNQQNINNSFSNNQNTPSINQVKNDYFNNNENKVISSNTPSYIKNNNINIPAHNNDILRNLDSVDMPEAQFNNTETSNTYTNIAISKNENLQNNSKNRENQKQVEKKVKNSSFSFLKILKSFFIFIFSIIVIFIVGLVGGIGGYLLAKNNFDSNEQKNEIIREITSTKVTEEESAIINVAKNNKKAVVSILVNRSLKTLRGKIDQNIASGSGFFVTDDGYIITNKHVVGDSGNSYKIILDNKEELDASLVDIDPILDIAFLKINVKDRKFDKVTLGESSNLQVGQSVIAIGNSLGEFSNTVSKGIISGLERQIVATDQSGNDSELLEDIIQTDASINPGNSGGPLLDINGNVIGVNVAKAQGGENIGFTIPIDYVRNILESVIKEGKIKRPFLGINYISITKNFAKENNLKYDYGALVSSQNNSSAVVKNSPADKAGIRLNDIILEINSIKIDENNSLRKVIQKYKVGDNIKVKILRGDSETEINITLENYKIN